MVTALHNERRYDTGQTKKPFYDLIRLFPSVLLKALFILSWMVSLIPQSLIFPPPGRHWSVSLPGSPRGISSTATIYSFPRMLTLVSSPIITNPWGLAIFSKPYDESNFQSALCKKSRMSSAQLLKQSILHSQSWICIVLTSLHSKGNCNSCKLICLRVCSWFWVSGHKCLWQVKIYK